MDIVDKITGDIYLATEFTSFKNESQNAIVSTGQTLSSSSNVQLAKALTIAGQTAHSYQDSGSANAYALTRTGSLEQPNSYIDGMRISFVTANANTGASTVNVSGLGVKAIVKAGDVALSAGDISENTYMELIYDPAADSASGGFILLYIPFKITYFTSSGTYNKPAGLKKVEVIAIGGGAGGGGVDGQGAGTHAASGGGGAGGFSRSVLSANEFGASETVTIGAGGTGGTGPGGSGASGGTTSFGTLVVAVGGNGGVGLTAQTLQRITLGGSGGAGASGSGNEKYTGGAGTPGISLGYTADSQTIGGVGGDSYFAGGGRPGLSPSTGVAGGAPGAGGSGASVFDVTTDYAGGAGKEGIVIIKEFY